MEKGFALLEILVVVVIVALLAGGGLYFNYARQSQNAAQVGASAIQQAERVRQEVDAQTSKEQGAIDQLTQPNGQMNMGGTTSAGQMSPQAAIDACSSKSSGASCSFNTPNGTISGLCNQVPGRSIACVPE